MTEKNKKKGMTLIELIVAMAILLIVLTILTSIFINIVKAQRQYLAMQDVQENARHIIETMTKEIRMSRIESCSNLPGSLGYYFDLNITAYNEQLPLAGGAVEYFVAPSSISGRVERNGESIMSSKARVSSSAFCVLGEEHPRLTFVIPLSHKDMPNAEIKVQNTVSSRYLFNL